MNRVNKIIDDGRRDFACYLIVQMLKSMDSKDLAEVDKLLDFVEMAVQGTQVQQVNRAEENLKKFLQNQNTQAMIDSLQFQQISDIDEHVKDLTQIITQLDKAYD